MKPLGAHLVAELLECDAIRLKDVDFLQTLVREILNEAGLDCLQVTGHQFAPGGATVLAIIGASHVALHTYPEAGHVSVDVFTCSTRYTAALQQVLDQLYVRLGAGSRRTLWLQRGNPLAVGESDWLVCTSSAGFELRYHIAAQVYREASPYQQIDIIDNEEFGRMLFLDNDLQVAAVDAETYAAQLVGPLEHCRRLPERIVVLGGGDGTVARALLALNVREVTVVDIDAAVVAASREHLAAIHQGALDNPLVRLEHDEAVRYLERCEPCDAVVCDLTMHPEAMTHEDRPTFLQHLFDRVRDRLQPGGMLTLQCASAYDRQTLELLEELLRARFPTVTFTECFLPSYGGRWVFAQAQRCEGERPA